MRSPLLALCIVLSNPSLADPPPPVWLKTPPAELRKSIAELANLLDDGYSELVSGFTHGLPIALNNDTSEVPGYVVEFSIEGWGGGNGHTLYLAYFAARRLDNDNPNPRIYRLVDVVPIGGKNWRSIHLDRTENNFIFLSGTTYRETDGACCPSQPIAVRYAVVNGRLEQLDEQNAG